MAFGETYVEAIINDYGNGVTPNPWYYFRLSDAPGATEVKSTSVLGATMLSVTATPTGGVEFDQLGALAGDDDRCASFDGRTGYITIPNDSLMDNITNSWTVAAWIYPTAGAPGNNSIVNRQWLSGTGAIPYWLGYGPTVFATNNLGTNIPANRVYGAFFNGAAWAAVADTADAPLFTWTFYVATYDSTVPILRLYKNGAQIATYTPGIANAARTGSATYIGKSGTSADFFPGKIDEVAIYGVAKPADSIKRFYDVGVGNVQARQTFIGRRWDTTAGTTSYFPGRIDEAAIYNYALSPEQIGTHWACGTIATPTTPQHIVEIAFNSAPTADYRDMAVSAPFGAYAYYRLGESSGTTMATETTVNNAPNGVYRGSPTLGVTGALPYDSNTAVTFSGSSQWGEGPSYGSILGYTPTSGPSWMLLEAWIKPTTIGTALPIMCFGGTAKDGPVFFTSVGTAALGGGNGSLFADFVDTNNLFHVVTTGGSVVTPDGNWHHVAAGYDGMTGYLFHNGTVVAQKTLGTFSCQIGNTTTDANIQLTVGRRLFTGGTAFFAGSVDEAAWYSTDYGYLGMTELVKMHYGARNLARPVTYTDVSAYVRETSVTPSGRNYELDRYESGHATLVVNNDDRRFEPGYTGSPYYPNVVPRKRLRIRDLKDGVYYPVFDGWIERWPIVWPQGHEHAEVTIEATDLLGLLQNAEVSAPGQGRNTASTRVLAGVSRLSLPGWATGPYAILDSWGGRGAILESEPDLAGSAVQIMQDAADTDGGELYVDKRGTVVFRPAGYRDDSLSLGTFGDSTGEISYRELAPSEDSDRIINWIEAGADGVTDDPVAIAHWDSVVQYGRHAVSVTTKNISNGDALKRARITLTNNAQPALRFDQIELIHSTLRVHDNAKLVQMLARGVGERVTVIRRPDGNNPPMQQQNLIGSIEYQRAPGVLVVRWHLLPVVSET